MMSPLRPGGTFGDRKDDSYEPVSQLGVFRPLPWISASPRLAIALLQHDLTQSFVATDVPNDDEVIAVDGAVSTNETASRLEMICTVEYAVT
jgi:hypothetical protein